jgi:hypothetical protein
VGREKRDKKMGLKIHPQFPRDAEEEEVIVRHTEQLDYE